MIIGFLFLFAISIGLVFLTILFIRKMKTIQIRWNGALRHIVATIVGWAAFTLLFSTFTLLDLLEKEKYSVHDLVMALYFPMAFFIVGMILLFSSLAASGK
jgi:hypothetical protein